MEKATENIEINRYTYMNFIELQIMFKLLYINILNHKLYDYKMLQYKINMSTSLCTHNSQSIIVRSYITV